MEYEIGRIDKTSKLANKELSAQVSIIEKALIAGKKAQWDLTFAVAKIVTEELWEDDFENQEKFAAYMNLSSGSISQYKGAVKFITATGASTQDISVGNAYLLSTMIKIVEDNNGVSYDSTEYLNFEKYCKENKIDLLHLTQKGLKEALSEYKKSLESVEEVESEEVETKEDSKEEDSKEEITEEVNNDIVILQGKEYNVNEEQLSAIKKILGI